MKDLVNQLCSDACAGRVPGSPGGRLARAFVRDAVRAAGLDPFEQAVPECGGANVLARIDGDIDRWVIIAAHYDHLGVDADGAIYRGADDNAASVAVLVEVAAALARDRPDGRGVIVAAFDGEEPPYFGTAAMGSEYFARHPIVPLDRVDMMVCMELVGHTIGGAELPAGVRDSLFALGAERSVGTSATMDALQAATKGVVVRPADAEIIPPLSDHLAFWERDVPFLLLTGGRSRHYHRPSDEPSTLSFERMSAVAQWLERFVRQTCGRPEERIVFRKDARNDRSTLQTLMAVTEQLAPLSPMADAGLQAAQQLLRLCDADGRLPAVRRAEPAQMIALLEEALA